MKVSSKSITLSVFPTKKVADIIVSVSIPVAQLADCCFRKLSACCPGPTARMQGTEASAIGFALFETVRDKLSGSALEVFKTKVSNIQCSTIESHLVITWNTQGTGTSLRKTVGLMLSCLNINKLFSKYVENMKFVTGKGSKREEFNFVAKTFITAIHKSVKIVVVGKINTDMAKLKDIIDVLSTKIPKMDMPSAKECIAPVYPKTESYPDMESMIYPVVKCSGIDIPIVADYIRNTSGGFSVGVCDEGVTIYNTSWQTKLNTLKESRRIKDYVDRKYVKLEDKEELPELFAYSALAAGTTTPNIVESMFSPKLKTSFISEHLIKALK